MSLNYLENSQEMDSEASRVAKHADAVLTLASASLGDEYRYQSLPLCVIDAVFSISIRYSIVQGVISRYCKYTGQVQNRDGEVLPPANEQESISSFCSRPEQAELATMAEQVYGSRNRTSPRNGILKAEAVLRFAKCLQSYGVDYLQDVPRVAENAEFERELRSIPGQRSGLSLQYFWMLAGSDEFVKPDRMVLRFLAAGLGREVAYAEATPLLRKSCNLLVEKYPKLTPRLLDHEVCKYQRALKEQSEPFSRNCAG